MIVYFKINPYLQILETHPDSFSKFQFWGVTQAVLLENSSRQWFLMDEFSSKTACVTTQKMKISEKFMDEFSRICR